MFRFYILYNPSDEMIFEGAFYDLMKKVWCQEFMDIRTGKL
jgi:hypothetical protein